MKDKYLKYGHSWLNMIVLNLPPMYTFLVVHSHCHFWKRKLLNFRSKTGLLELVSICKILNRYHCYLKRFYKSNECFPSGGNARSPEDQLGKHGEKQTLGEKAYFCFCKKPLCPSGLLLAFWWLVITENMDILLKLLVYIKYF